MINRKFILSADEFGLSKAENQAVLEGYVNGFLTNANICVNSEAFYSAIHDILPDCPNLSIGICLNIQKGKALTHCTLLTDSQGCFNKDFQHIQLNIKNKELLKQIETEFEAQILKAQNEIKIFNISSTNHIHAIPELFEIVCELAKKYGVQHIRTHFEELYFIPEISKHLNLAYINNVHNLFRLNKYTKTNKKTLNKYGLKTNDYVIGIGYKNMMSSSAIEYGLKNLDENCLIEAIIHPCKSIESEQARKNEFILTQDLTLKDTITRLGYDFTNYKNLN